MNTGPCQLGVRIFQKAGLQSKMDPVIWSLNMKTACKTFFQASDKRIGPSFAWYLGYIVQAHAYHWFYPHE